MIRMLLALTVAAVAAAAGSAAGWLFAADLPTDRQARALVAAAVPDQQAAIVNRFDVSFGYENGRYTPGFVTVTINYPDSAADSDLAIRVEQGFERMGWAVSNAGDGSGFEESVGDGLSMRLINAAYCEPREPQWCGSEIGGSGPFPALALRFQPAAPWPVVPLSVVAWFAGLVAGWRLGGRSRLRWLGGSGLVLMLPAVVAVTAGTVRPGNEPAWASLMDRQFGVLALAGAILLVGP
ncbi:hypothetical protein [Actinoplanes philippinensis]|uniref:hypothetical protein n=1 Tax=Actinoplanes philippinensis TaxID=35752 RepID=UPI0033C50145